MAGEIKRLLRPHLADVQTYEAVDPPELIARRAGIPESEIVKLNGNENPYGGSPKVAAAVANAPVHIYPDPLQRKVRQALSEYTGAASEEIIAGAGSDELIDLMFRLFMEPGDKVLDFDPTFAMYGFLARIAGGETAMVQRNEVFDIDVSAAKDALDDRTKIIFLASPNNPTGNLTPREHVRELLDTGRIVVVDEAYYEFCDSTVADMVSEHENLVVLRTLSKWAGLAGLRIGYGIMNEELVQHVIDIKQPYNISVAAEAALLASLEDSQLLLDNVGKIVAERDRMTGLLDEIAGVTPWPSSGNFVLCRLESAEKAKQVFEMLAQRGIVVRMFSSERLRDFFRVAVGTPRRDRHFRECPEGSDIVHQCVSISDRQ